MKFVTMIVIVQSPQSLTEVNDVIKNALIKSINQLVIFEENDPNLKRHERNLCRKSFVVSVLRRNGSSNSI